MAIHYGFQCTGFHIFVVVVKLFLSMFFGKRILIIFNCLLLIYRNRILLSLPCILIINLLKLILTTVVCKQTCHLRIETGLTSIFIIFVFYFSYLVALVRNWNKMLNGGCDSGRLCLVVILGGTHSVFTLKYNLNYSFLTGWGSSLLFLVSWDFLSWISWISFNAYFTSPTMLTSTQPHVHYNQKMLLSMSKIDTWSLVSDLTWYYASKWGYYIGIWTLFCSTRKLRSDIFKKLLFYTVTRVLKLIFFLIHLVSLVKNKCNTNYKIVKCNLKSFFSSCAQLHSSQIFC